MVRRSRILIVEDHKDLLERYRAWLERADFDVDCSPGKEDALQKVAERIYDGALIDVMLTNSPRDRGGFEVIDAIAENEEGTALVILSGSSNVDVPHTILRAWHS